MPAKRSARLSGKRAAQAVAAPPKKKSRKPEPSPSTQSSESAPAAPQPTQELNLSPGLIDQLVSRVADEVTKRMTGSAHVWDYSILHGPQRWANTFPAAAGKKQSPIDIKASCVQHDPTLSQTPLHALYMKDSTYTIKNNGHSVEVSQSSGNGYQLSGGPLLHKYQFKQFHFHWGASDEQGSEHLVNGKAYPAELHLVHWNVDLYENFETALTQQNGLAVIGVFLEICDECEKLTPICDLLPRVQYKDDKYRMKSSFDPGSLIPSTKDYWTYSGSLTTPPCSESVTWIVLKETITISRKQMELFRALHGFPFWQTTGPNIVDNYREVMPLNGRVIRSTFPVD